MVRYCFVADDEGNPVPTDFTELLKRTGNINPFSLPTSLAGTDARVKMLVSAQLMAGFHAQIGLPGGNDPGDIVVLGGDASQVTFNMPCSDFTIMSLQGGMFCPVKTLKASQDPDKPWTFSSKVDLRLASADKGAYTKLPTDVQSAIKNLSADSFSVQQLLFDLTNSQLSAVPTISGVAFGSVEAMLLDQYFRNGYFQTLRKNGEPVLGATVTSKVRHTSSLNMTDFNFHAQTYKPVSPETYGLNTLNYLCAVDGKPLPPAVAFDWGWVTPDELKEHDGVISINRNTFANWFCTQLAAHVRANSWAFNVKIDWVGPLGTTALFRITPAPNQTPVDTKQPTGPDVIKYTHTYSSYDQAGLDCPQVQFWSYL